MSERISVTHVITSLSTGGAEMMLYKLLSHRDSSRFRFDVISLSDPGPIGDQIHGLGISVSSLRMARGVPDPRGFLRLALEFRRRRPDVVQTWMYHADLVGGLSARAIGGIPIAWNVRQVGPSSEMNKRSTLWTISACARLSRWVPARIVCGSGAALRIHSGLGYPRDKMVVIPNGFDLAAFRPDPEARQSVRAELGLPPSSLLVGLVARYDVFKDHRNFVQAAALLSARRPEVHYLLCGDGIGWDNQELAGFVDAVADRSRFHLLGLRHDVARLTAALDLACCSSASESFPNVVGEAMACGVPCVVTDVGDSAVIVGDTGRVVPPRDPGALAAALDELVALGEEGRAGLGRAARSRIDSRYSLESVATRYQDLYQELHSVRHRRFS